MLSSLKQLSLFIIVFASLVVSINVFGCVADDLLNEQQSITSQSQVYNFSVTSFLVADINQTNSLAQHHSQISHNEAESNTHKNSKCCECDNCASCNGCASSCNAVLFSATVDKNLAINPLARINQQHVIYASTSQTPLNPPPIH
ncbi:MAG: hypothetical protein COB38_02185 [Gammaproteobacteria bacterium]|nr:MAG: hypothetical protein COB38_02185 [Gammaproteobacteria bacterium]